MRYIDIADAAIEGYDITSAVTWLHAGRTAFKLVHRLQGGTDAEVEARSRAGAGTGAGAGAGVTGSGAMGKEGYEIKDGDLAKIKQLRGIGEVLLGAMRILVSVDGGGTMWKLHGSWIFQPRYSPEVSCTVWGLKLIPMIGQTNSILCH